MILSDIKEYLQTQGQASLRDMAVRFDVSESALIEMIGHWERKGKITHVDNGGCGNPCGQKCSSCPMKCMMVYQWADSGADDSQ